MKSVVFLFPGQGSQRSGMGLDFIEAYPSARERYEQAEAILGWSVEDLAKSDNAAKPEGADNLNVTLYTQPSLYTLSCVIAEVLAEAGVEPSLTAGHSAGEFAALTAAGAWDFETGLRVIAERARLMHETAKPGAMAAVLGMNPDALEAACAAWSDGVVRIANFNSPKQTVITGDREAVKAIGPVLKEQGARRVVPLKVSGAFHSPLMEEAQQSFAEYMKDVKINDPRIPWVSNNTAEKVSDAETVRAHLVNQFCEPVRWMQSMASIESECGTAVETGPGEVLKGLAKACCGDLTCLSTDTVDGLKAAVETIASQNEN